MFLGKALTSGGFKMSDNYAALKAEKAARQARYVEKVINDAFPPSANRSSNLKGVRKSKAPLSAPLF